MRRGKGWGTPWIVVGKSGAQGLCQRCGGTFELKVPVLLDVWLAAMQAFIRCHKRCKPAELPDLVAPLTVPTAAPGI